MEPISTLRSGDTHACSLPPFPVPLPSVYSQVLSRMGREANPSHAEAVRLRGSGVEWAASLKEAKLLLTYRPCHLGLCLFEIDIIKHGDIIKQGAPAQTATPSTEHEPRDKPPAHCAGIGIHADAADPAGRRAHATTLPRRRPGGSTRTRWRRCCCRCSLLLGAPTPPLRWEHAHHRRRRCRRCSCGSAHTRRRSAGSTHITGRRRCRRCSCSSMRPHRRSDGSTRTTGRCCYRRCSRGSARPHRR